MKFRAADSIETGEILAIFDQALPEVYDYLLYRCRDRVLAEDLTSETFLAAVSAVRGGHSGDLTVGWLIGIARHKLADHWRRNARGRAIRGDRRQAHGREMPPVIEPGVAMDVLATMSPIQRGGVDAAPRRRSLCARSSRATRSIGARDRDTARAGASRIPPPLRRREEVRLMSDPLDVLHRANGRTEPEPEFRAALMAQLRELSPTPRSISIRASARARPAARGLC